MFRPLAANLGLRYATSRRSFISFISLVAVTGLVLSVAVLLLVTSVMNGFERELRERVLGIVPHLTLHGRPALRDWQPLAQQVSAVPGVLGVAPFVQGAGLAVTLDQSAGVSVTGIDPQLHDQASNLTRYVGTEAMAALQPGSFNVLLGLALAEELGLQPGSRFTLVLPDANVTLAGIRPRQKQVTLAGVVDSKSELDKRTLYMHIDDAALLFRLTGAVHGLQVRTADLFAVGDISGQLLRLDTQVSFSISTWMRQHGNLYQAIGFQRAMLFLLLSLLVGVAAFNLVSSLIMVVNQRRGDVAILRTLGADGRTIVLAFVMLGGLVGLLGVGLGLLLGVLGSLFIQDGYLWLETHLGLNLMSQYFVTYLPAELRLADLMLVALVAFGLCFLSTLYPAWRAAALKPADVLRYE